MTSPRPVSHHVAMARLSQLGGLRRSRLAASTLVTPVILASSARSRVEMDQCEPTTTGKGGGCAAVFTGRSRPHQLGGANRATI